MLRSHIIEAVEALRQRKCRPEREAIAHYVLRKYGVPFQEVFSELENIVDLGDLVKVEYKGSTSYRSLEAFDPNASPLLTKHSKILNSCKTTRYILTAVSELLVENESFSTEGIPPDQIKARLAVYEPTRFTPETVKIFLDREINIGTLVEGPEKRLFPKDLPIPGRTVPEKKMRGRKSNSAKAKEAAAAAEPPPLPGTVNEEVVFAVKSVPSASPPKAVRAYGRKSAAEKVAELMSASAEPPEEASPVQTKPEETAAGRSVRNKRKKEVFDPSDIVPKKKLSLTPTLKEKPAPPAPKMKSPPPPVPPRKSNAGRKKKVDPEPEPEPDLEPDSFAELCEHCQRHKNIKGAVEDFLICSDCNVTYHPSCLDYTKEQAAHVMERGTWQCSECKACQVCQDQCTEGPDTILCTSCDTGFHYKCLKMSHKPGGNSWLCPGCSDNGENSNMKIEAAVDEVVVETEEEEKLQQTEEVEVEVKAEGNAEFEPEVSEIIQPEPVPEEPKKKPGRPPKKRIITLHLKPEPETRREPTPPPCKDPEAEAELQIPADASKWTPAHVEAYFKKHGLKDEGLLFREQEIDGLALLLMRRQDIVSGMKLLLGPALKAHRLIVELQMITRR